MSWNLEYGSRLRAFEHVYEKTGVMPSALAKRPDVPEYLLEYWNGFVSLDKSRLWIFGQPQGISYSEILAYSQIKGFTADEVGDFAQLIGSLDTHYLNWRAKDGKT